ncbi:MAG TPA: FAD-linked oxidase C-terminal domain-containing protein [Opitutales bacterium]|nr:FAD-linked oxidase C-terminal domain-containing protein [Opitutales bacterium]
MKTARALVERLETLLGAEKVLTEAEDLIPYGFDGTAAIRQQPQCVVFPETVEEISEILKFASAEGFPVVTRGSGTGLSGGSVPAAEGIVMCLLKFNRILELDEKNLTIFVECGVLTNDVFNAADEVGLFYPPDPGSMIVSTIGGNVAENSGGLRGLKYGVTRNYVMGLEVVLPDGEICWYGNKCVKDVAGYNMKDLFIGSEGTLGIITKVLLRLLPKPQARKTMLAEFPTMEAASDTVSAIIQKKIIPCTLEFLDRITIKCVEDFAKIGLPLDAEAVLLMESDGHPAVVEEEAETMAQIAREHGATKVQVAKTAAESERLATARRAAFSALARISPTTVLEDATVPRSELTRMIKFIQDVGERYKLMIGTFGHMGDGNLHPTFLTDEKNTEEMERVEKAMVEIFDYAIELGGTITGEHGVGLAKKKFLPRQFSDASFQLMKTLKQSIDPKNILNPGKMFD